MIVRSFPVLTGVALLASFAGLSSGASSPSWIKGVTFSTNADNSSSELAAITSNNISAADTIHSAEADERIARADRHFNAGRQLYFQGNLAGARREFDAAVDALLNASDNLPDRNRIERRLDEISDQIYRFDVEKLGAGMTEDAVVFDKAPIDEISNLTFAADPNSLPSDPGLAPKLKNELNQTTSGIPLDLTDPVLRFVHYFSTDRGREILLAGFKRSGRYRPLIERIFAEEGVPREFIYLAQAESGFLPRAVSNKQAVGMWQFIAGTGSRYDLVRTAGLDERLDPEKATRAAAKYLKDLYARYGDWYLAMAAYNCGEGNVDRAVERTGYSDYWELLKRRALPRETSAYVPIIVAMTIMAKNPQDYGLESIDVDPAVEYENIQLTAPTNLDLVADAALQPVSMIRDLNPALLTTVAPAGFQIHVPKGTAQATLAALETVPAPNRNAWRIHHVTAGDTLAAIAQTYHTTADRIVAANNSADALEAGDVLLIPATYHAPAATVLHGQARTSRRKALTPRPQQSSPKGASAHVPQTHAPQTQAKLVAARHLTGPALHRKAVVRTAVLQQH
ncbi:MAG TPA: transglycosylase SLT domain-containing protein [Bryobacteraceae bacterium]|jgi:membrane-bound lytic murein transglycosylase D|nr:transglycosylase SLT domain-containing protein [Bryobacteraceae bacterium]